MVWLPSNFIPEVDLYLLKAAAAMNGYFNLQLTGLPDEANAGEAAAVFKTMCRQATSDKGRRGEDEDASSVSKHIGVMSVINLLYFKKIFLIVIEKFEHCLNFTMTLN